MSIIKTQLKLGDKNYNLTLIKPIRSLKRKNPSLDFQKNQGTKKDPIASGWQTCINGDCLVSFQQRTFGSW